MKTSASLNNINNKRNKLDFNEKNIFKNKFELKNNNNVSKIVKNDRGITFNILKNNEFQCKSKKNHEEEDDYKNDVYNKNISNFKLFSDIINDNDHKYNTVSSFNSFQKKYKDINSYEILIKNKNYKRKKINRNNDLDSALLYSDLNLTYESNNKNIFVKKNSKFRLIDKDRNHFTKIIRIFDKNHKMIQNKNNKKFSKRKINRNGFILKAKKIVINNNNYASKNKTKFSKKYKKQILTRNKYLDYCHSHTKSSSQPFIEINNKKNKSDYITEIRNKMESTDHKDIKSKAEKAVLSSENDMKSISKSIIYKYSHTPNASIDSYEGNKVEEDSDTKRKLKNQSIFIGLNKKKISDDNSRNTNSKDNNNNSKSNIKSPRVFFRGDKKKTKSMFENDYSNEIGENYIKNENNKLETEQKQEHEPRIIFKRIDNFKNGKEIEKKERNENKNKNKNKRFIYPKYIIAKNNKEKSDIMNHYNSNVIKNNKSEISLAKMPLYSPIKKDSYISYLIENNQSKINEKKDTIALNGSSNVFDSQNKTNENLKTKNKKSNYNLKNFFQNKILSKNKDNYNLIKSVNNVQVPDLKDKLDNIKSEIAKKNDDQNQHKKEMIKNNRSFIWNNPRIKGGERITNDLIEIKMNDSLPQINKKLILNKSETTTDRSKEKKEIKQEKQSNRYIFKRFHLGNKNQNNNNINKENNDNKIKENNTYNENINNKESDNRSNKFQRGKHKNEEIKYISNDKIRKKEEISDNSTMIIKINNTMVNSTSMDNIKQSKKDKNNANEIEITKNEIHMKNSDDNDKNKDKGKNINNKKKHYFFVRK